MKERNEYMKIRDYCLPCLVNQVVKVAHMSHAQNKEELYHQVFDYLSSLEDVYKRQSVFNSSRS